MTSENYLFYIFFIENKRDDGRTHYKFWLCHIDISNSNDHTNDKIASTTPKKENPELYCPATHHTIMPRSSKQIPTSTASPYMDKQQKQSILTFDPTNRDNISTQPQRTLTQGLVQSDTVYSVSSRRVFCNLLVITFTGWLHRCNCFYGHQANHAKQKKQNRPDCDPAVLITLNTRLL